MASAPLTPVAVRMRVSFDGLTEPGRVLGYRAWRAYLFMCDYERDQGRPPDYDEICEGAGVGTPGEVSRIVKALNTRGLVALNDEGGRRGVTRIKTVKPLTM